MASRSSFGVVPSRCSAGMPASTNRSVMCWLCATELAKTMVRMPSA